MSPERFENFYSNDDKQAPEQEFESLSPAEQERLKQSWSKVEALLHDMEKLSVESANVSKVENQDKNKIKAISQEIYDFYSRLFEDEENADPMQIEIGLANDIVDTFIARDGSGKIISLLQSQKVELASGDRSELMFLVWYVGTDENYKGKPLTRDLFRLALWDLLEKSKNELKPIKALVGETEDEVEGLFNRYGLNRIYYKNKEKVLEVPFEAPPEDESREGVPEHLMIRLLDDSKTISVNELLQIVDGIYGQYTRPEYFTPEYLQYAQEFYDEETNIPINSLTAKAYHEDYKNIVANIRKKLAKSLSKAEGNLFLQSRRKRDNRV